MCSLYSPQLLSIGGWTYSPKFHPVVVSRSARIEFVRSSIKLLEDLGLDGLDVDYEYPTNDEQARAYVELLRLLREGLDEHAAKKGRDCHFELSVRLRTTLYSLKALTNPISTDP